MNNSVAILINSCDAYKEVTELSLCAIEEYWSPCNYHIYINTESVNYRHSKLNLVSLNNSNVNNTKWGYRIKSALNRIEEDLIIVIYDDFVLESAVDIEKLESLIAKMVLNPNIACVYLKHTDFVLTYCKDYDLHTVNPENYYRINSGPAIWRKSVLEKLIKPYDNPWAWEFFAMYRSLAKNQIICSVSNSQNNVYNYNHIKGGAVYRGKWVAEVVQPKILKYNLKINMNERGVLNINELSPRTFFWKINFLVQGFRMVGFSSLHLLIYFAKSKFEHYFNKK